jgi:hypothetical protein
MQAATQPANTATALPVTNTAKWNEYSFVKVPRWLLLGNEARLSANERNMILCLLGGGFNKGDEHEANVSMNNLAKATSTSKGTVKRTLRDLQEKALVEISEPSTVAGPGGGRTSQKYKVNVKTLDAWHRSGIAEAEPTVLSRIPSGIEPTVRCSTPDGTGARGNHEAIESRRIDLQKGETGGRRQLSWPGDDN